MLGVNKYCITSKPASAAVLSIPKRKEIQSMIDKLVDSLNGLEEERFMWLDEKPAISKKDISDLAIIIDDIDNKIEVYGSRIDKLEHQLKSLKF
jgi:hypothetical protein